MKREQHDIIELHSALLRWTGVERLTDAGDMKKRKAFLCQPGLEVGSVSDSLMHCQIMEILPRKSVRYVSACTTKPQLPMQGREAVSFSPFYLSPRPPSHSQFRSVKPLFNEIHMW